MNPTIFILTDFGTSDPFVGIMKSVIDGIAPQTKTIDLTHEIPPGDIQRGAVVLWQSLPYIPQGSVILGVVDPGVGTNRAPMILKTKERTFVGPDNGLISFVAGEKPQAWKLQNPKLALPSPRMTFHGRDIFAPAAAHASLGVPGHQFGEAIPDLQVIPHPELTLFPEGIRGQILHADRFGNLLTSLGIFNPAEQERHELLPWLGDFSATTADLNHAVLELPDGKRLNFSPTFAKIPEGECGVIVGSSGLLEIAANRQSAANLLNLRGGEFVRLSYRH